MNYRALLGIGLVTLAASTQALAGATLDRVQKNKELVNVLMESYPPFSFLNDKNELDGFDRSEERRVGKECPV